MGRYHLPTQGWQWVAKTGFCQKLTFLKILIFFFIFKNFQKTGIYVLDHYIVHVRTKFQADFIFGSHFITLKRCCPSDGSKVPTH